MDFKAEDLEDFMRQARDQPLRVKVQPLRQFLFVILLSYNFILIFSVIPVVKFFKSSL